MSAWKNVEDHQDKYVCNSEEAKSATDEEWINIVQNCFNEIRFIYVEHKNCVEHDNAVAIVLNLRNVCENNFKENYDNLYDSVNNNYGKEIILRERQLITKAFEEIQLAHKKLWLY